jgi:ribonuclease HI
MHNKPMPDLPHATIYTDGGCIGNPGPGGYGVVLQLSSKTQELSGGFSKTTNNRMELFAAIIGLEALTQPHQVTLFSDSKYLVDAVEKGWVYRWQANRWMRGRKQKTENTDLWKRLLLLLETHKVRFQWVKGHAGDPANERCDQLANNAAKQPGLPPDPGFTPQNSQPALF